MLLYSFVNLFIPCIISLFLSHYLILSSTLSYVFCPWNLLVLLFHYFLHAYEGSGRKPVPLHATFPSKPAEVSSVKELFEFICTGPLLEKIGVTSEKIAKSIDNWILYGSQLCRLFKLNEMYLTEPQKIRIYHYYIPVFLWCEQEISYHSSMFKGEDEIPPLVVHLTFFLMILRAGTSCCFLWGNECELETLNLLICIFNEKIPVIFCGHINILNVSLFLLQIGFSAPQGCGKTTLVFALDFLFQLNGR